MRVLFWSGTFWPNIGGVEVLAARFLPALRERGHEYIVIAPKHDPDLPDEARYQKIPVYRFPFRHNAVEKNIDHVLEIRKKVAALKRAFAPDLIHINAVGVDNFFHLTTADAYPAPVLVTLHGKWSKQANGIVEKSLRTADWVVGCSAAILEEGQRLARQITSRSSVIYNGVEAPIILPAPLPFNPPRLLCLGRLAPDKGFDLALTAFRTIRERFHQARLVIAGDGPQRAGLEKHAVSQGISEAVEFVGWVTPEKVPSLINSSTMIVMPSREDSLPLVALEAAALARPIVATCAGGLPEIVAHRQTGLLVDKENSAALADAICLLLGAPEAAVRMGQAARRRTETMFKWQSHVDAYDILYKKLHSDRPVSQL